MESTSRERKNRCKQNRRKVGKTAFIIQVVMRSEIKVAKCVSQLSRKAAKPTQVDEERILRPTEEVLLRNSAK